MLFNTQGLFFMARKEYANKFVNRFFFLFLSHGVSEHGRVREGGDPSWGLGYEHGEEKFLLESWLQHKVSEATQT
jgi:hypothetical protein